MDPKKTREKLLEKFRQICAERVNTLISLFSKLIKTPADAQALDQLMREIHTLKGELRIMGFSDGGKIVHKLEDGLKKLRDNAFSNASTYLDLFSEGLDVTSSNVMRGAEIDVDDLIKQVEAWEGSYTPKAEKKAKPSKKKKAPKKEPPSQQPASDDKKMAIANVVRVSGAKLDRLGDMAGDLFTSHLRLSKLTLSLDDILNDVRNLGVVLEQADLGAELANLPADMNPAWQCQKLTHALAQFRRSFNDRASGMATSLDQTIEHVRELRLLPVSTVFSMYQTAAREIARDRGKKLGIEIEGETTMVDRSVLDALNDILLHMIRNAVDHGIEAPDDRKKLKKPEQGALSLRARLVGDRILIDVEDDGRGINAKKVKSSALRKGLITELEAENLDDEGAMALIFRPGFSTVDQATDLSGRGVGMDVVWTKVQELGGAVQIKSTPAKGTCFTIELPTSIAITRVLLFRSAGQIFAVLATFVERVVRLEPSALINVTGGQAIVLDEQTIPAAEAAKVLRLGESGRSNGKLPAVVLEHGGRALALLVDELLGERELTIKPLGPFLTGVRGISGAAMLEDGLVILVLHAGNIVTSAARAQPKSMRVSPRPERKAMRALLVEDSLITRELERSMLASLGLLVEEAANGKEAMEKLEGSDFDIIVSDVEMPYLDGFELCRRVKQDERWAQIPVILVTTRGSPEDRQRGIEVGADAYVVKSEFRSKDFVEVVRRFLS